MANREEQIGAGSAGRGVPTIAAVCAIGLVAGFLASLVVGGDGLLRYLLSGIIGALVGSYVLNTLRLRLPIRHPLLERIATATIGAVLVVVVARLIA